MNLHLPYKRQASRFNKKTAKRQKQTKKMLAKKLHFIVVWKRSLDNRLNKIGAAIVRASPPWLKKVGSVVKRPFSYAVMRIRRFLARRPHRSFRMTRRRDYKRSLALPGYWSFTNQVRAMLWRNKKLFGGLMATYFLVALAIQGFGQQDAYKSLSDTLNQTGGEVFTGNWGKVGQAGLLLITSVTTGLTPNVTQAQSVLGGLTVFFAWLATVWALRNVMADRFVRVRDAVYSSGSPVISTVMVAFVIALQLLPVAIAILIYTTALESFSIAGVEGMLLWIGVVLLIVLSLYWITSTIIALVVVTLPGMYPFQAIRTAGDLVIGRRLRVLLRLVWGAVLVVVSWALIVIPVIIGDAWVKKAWPTIEWIPTVPIVILLMSSITIISAAAYVYMLYRKVVDDDAKPA